MNRARVFHSDKERDRVCAESLDAVNQLNTAAEDYTRKALGLLQVALEARPQCTQALALRAALRTSSGDVCGALDDLSTLIQCEESALRSLDAPPSLTVSDRRRLAAVYAQHARLQRRARNEKHHSASSSGETCCSPLWDAETTIADYQRAMELEPDNGQWPYELGLTRVQLADEKESAEGQQGVGQASRGARDELDKACAAFQTGLACCKAQPSLSALSHQSPLPSSLAQTGPLRTSRKSHSATTTAAAASTAASATTTVSGAVVPHKSGGTATYLTCKLMLARCRLRLGDAAQALSVLGSAKEMSNGIKVHALLGYAHDLAGDARSACTEFQRAVEANPRSVAEQLHLGICYLRQGQVAESLHHLNEAVLLDRDNPWLRFYHGCAHLLHGDAAPALSCFQEATALERRPEFLFAEASLHTQGDHFPAARELLWEVVGLKAAHTTEATFLLGVMDELSGDPVVALELYHITLDALETAASATPPPAAAAAARSDSLDTRAQERRCSLRVRGARTSSTSPPTGRTSAERRQSRDTVSTRDRASLRGSPASAGPVDEQPKGGASAASSRTTLRQTATLEMLCWLVERMGMCYAKMGCHSLALRYFRRGQALWKYVGTVPHAGGATAAASAQRTLRLRIAQVQLCGGNPYGAQQSLRSVADSESSTFDELFCLSTALRLLGNLAAAQTVCDAAAHALSALQATQKAVSPASSSTPRSVPIDAMTVAAHYANRASLVFDIGDYERCLEAARKGLAVCQEAEGNPSPPWVSSLRAELLYMRGRTEFALGQHGAAVESFEAAGREAPQLAETCEFCYSLSVSLASHGGADQEALEWFTRAIRADSARAATAERKAAGRQDPDGRDAELSSELAILAHHERAKLHQVLGHAAAAVADFTVVLSAQPRNIDALVRRSFALKTTGDFAAAAADWQAAGALDESGVLSSLDLQCLFDVPYVEVCEPGEEEGTACNGHPRPTPVS